MRKAFNTEVNTAAVLHRQTSHIQQQQNQTPT